MRSRIHILFLSIALCVLFSACVAAHDEVDPSRLPADWAAAIAPSINRSALAGTYDNTGQLLHETVESHRERLSRLLFPELETQPKVDQVRLLFTASGSLQIQLLHHGDVIQSKVVDVRRNFTTGAISFSPPRQTGAGGNLAAATTTKSELTLYKGKDGDLYVKASSFTVGVVAAVVPIKATTENWGHWAAVHGR